VLASFQFQDRQAGTHVLLRALPPLAVQVEGRRPTSYQSPSGDVPRLVTPWSAGPPMVVPKCHHVPTAIPARPMLCPRNRGYTEVVVGDLRHLIPLKPGRVSNRLLKVRRSVAPGYHIEPVAVTSIFGHAPLIGRQQHCACCGTEAFTSISRSSPDATSRLVIS